MRRFLFARCACVVLDKWRLLITIIILLFIVFEKITFQFLGKKKLKIILGFYGVVKTVVSFKVVLTLPICIINKNYARLKSS